MRPVLYLDLDDTLIAWPDGREGSPRGGPGAHEFVAWALDHYEVRWLTTWCPGGCMDEKLLQSLARMLRLPPETLRSIRGIDWSDSGCKLDGIAWVEHVVMGRPFVWLEDELGFGDRERRFLESHGHFEHYRHVNVTRDPGSLARLHAELRAATGEDPAG